MNASLCRRLAGWSLAVVLVFACGCGEVDVPADEPVSRLKLLNRYPQHGEGDVPADLIAIATFSHRVVIGEQGTSAVNAGSFTLEKDGAAVSCTVSASELDEMNATALLAPVAPLESGSTYDLCLSGQIRGTTDEGKPTEPLGDVMCTACGMDDSCDLRVCEVYDTCDDAQECNCIQFTVQ